MVEVVSAALEDQLVDPLIFKSTITASHDIQPKAGIAHVTLKGSNHYISTTVQGFLEYILVVLVGWIHRLFSNYV